MDICPDQVKFVLNEVFVGMKFFKGDDLGIPDDSQVSRRFVGINHYCIDTFPIFFVDCNHNGVGTFGFLHVEYCRAFLSNLFLYDPVLRGAIEPSYGPRDEIYGI